jgi:hypothetical protein
VWEVTVAAVGDDRVELTGHVQPERHLQTGTGMTEPGVPDADEFRLMLAMTPSCRLPESVRNRPELNRPPVTLIGSGQRRG